MLEMREHRAPSDVSDALYVADGNIGKSFNITRAKRQIGCEGLLQFLKL